LRTGFTALLALCLGVVLAFLAIPIIALFTEVPLGPPICWRRGASGAARW
jgi:hypothetical protein